MISPAARFIVLSTKMVGGVISSVVFSMVFSVRVDLVLLLVVGNKLPDCTMGISVLLFRPLSEGAAVVGFTVTSSSIVFNVWLVVGVTSGGIIKVTESLAWLEVWLVV